MQGVNNMEYMGMLPAYYATASPTGPQGAFYGGLLPNDPAFRAPQYQDLDGADIPNLLLSLLLTLSSSLIRSHTMQGVNNMEYMGMLPAYYATASPTGPQGAFYGGLLPNDPAFRAPQYQDLDGADIPNADGTQSTFELRAPRLDVGSDQRDKAHAHRRKCEPQHECEWCRKRFTRKPNRDEHILRHENQLTFSCDVAGCTQRFNTPSDLRSHGRRCHDRGAAEAQAE